MSSYKKVQPQFFIQVEVLVLENNKWNNMSLHFLILSICLNGFIGLFDLDFFFFWGGGGGRGSIIATLIEELKLLIFT